MTKAADSELIEKLKSENLEFRKLFKEHENYEKQLKAFDNKKYLTTEETIERKRIQKLKLAGKDKIELILSKYREK